MKLCKLFAWALVAITVAEVPAQAAWNNVFQPTCFGRSRTSGYSSGYYYAPSYSNYTPSYYYSPPAVAVAQYAPATPTCSTCQSSPAPVVAQAPPPANDCQQCTTKYVQRSYYQPVTTYESRSYYEPVTTYQSSTYYEPVSSYQTSYYYDPCSCGYKAQCQQVTSYVARQQCCPVQSWVQRCTQVPVTSYKQMYYLEPQTTCCSTTIGAPIPQQQQQQPCTGPGCAPSGPSGPTIQQNPTVAPPSGPSGPASGTSYYPGGLTSNTAPKADPIATGTNAWRPAVNLTSVTPEPKAEPAVNGQVVRTDRTPTANTQILFVNATTGARHSATTNDAGRFQVALGAGNYHVFMTTSSGSAAYHSLVNVDRTRDVNLVNQ